MLKIKDNVDLKELEKFGFRENLKGQYLKQTVMICKNRNIQGRTGTSGWSKMYAVEKQLLDIAKALLIMEITVLVLMI